MEIRHLTSFLQLATLGSFTKAGESLGYSQANISLQIRQLELELGVPLFDRIGKKAYLTQYGEMLVPYAQEIISSINTVKNLFYEKENLRGTLRVGFTESLFEFLFRDTLLAYHRLFPLVTVDVSVDSTSTLIKMLHTGQLDIVCLIGDFLADPDLLCWNNMECGIIIVASNDHPLASRLKPDPGDLDGKEFVLMEDSAPYVINFDRWLRDEEIEITKSIKVQIPFGARQLLYKDSYLSVLPDFTVRHDIDDGLLTHIDVEGFSQSENVQFLTHRSRALTPQIEGFLEEATAVFNNLFEN